MRYFIVLGSLIALVQAPTVYKGDQLFKVLLKKNKWVKEEVCDIRNNEYSRLDIEDEPIPLMPKSK